jgi:D-sedoheptulose 7-phosphate isomerase
VAELGREMSEIKKHLQNVTEALAQMDTTGIEEVISAILKAHREGRPVLTCGNGGSAATALHFASDLRSCGIQAWDLLGPSKLTQIANDQGYSTVFSNQHIPGAVVISFSCSGTSDNIKRLAYIVGDNEMILFSSDWLKRPPQNVFVIKVPSTDYEAIEDVHLVLCHAIKKEIRVRLGL